MSEARSRRVLHIITVLSVGGVEVWLVALLRHMQELGADHESFDILLTGGKQGDLDQVASALGATLHYVPFSRRNLFRFSRRFRALLRSRQYVAIHDHQDYSAGWHFLAGAGLLPPIRIVHVHNPPARLRAEQRTRLRRRLLAASGDVLRRFATHILGTSAEILRAYGFTSSAYPAQVIRALHCGFDTAPFAMDHGKANAEVCSELGWPIGSRLAIFVGRLDGFDPSNPGWHHKNPQFALEVARLLVERDPDLRFAVVGGGEAVRLHLEKQVAGWGLSDRIRFVGRRLDVAKFMAASNALIFPSLEEGLGMVAVEAQAAGLRVVASDSVPREAVVVDELVSFMPLSAGASAWADEMQRMLDLPRFDVSKASSELRSSPYSIDESYKALHYIYAGTNAR